jgi:hypothetical protein
VNGAGRRRALVAWRVTIVGVIVVGLVVAATW